MRTLRDSCLVFIVACLAYATDEGRCQMMKLHACFPTRAPLNVFWGWVRLRAEGCGLGSSLLARYTELPGKSRKSPDRTRRMLANGLWEQRMSTVARPECHGKCTGLSARLPRGRFSPALTKPCSRSSLQISAASAFSTTASATPSEFIIPRTWTQAL